MVESDEDLAMHLRVGLGPLIIQRDWTDKSRSTNYAYCWAVGVDDLKRDAESSCARACILVLIPCSSWTDTGYSMLNIVLGDTGHICQE